jgi:membrane protein YqaA with SNARE-associated domain
MSLLLLCLATFAVSIVSALIPVVNIEIYLLGAAALAPRAMAVPLALSATVGAMIGKVVLYYTARGAVRLPGERLRRGLAAAQAQLEARPRMGKLVYFASATVGLPPYYVMSLAAGACGMNLPFFLVAGFIGRLVRFTAIVLLPQVAERFVG